MLHLSASTSYLTTSEPCALASQPQCRGLSARRNGYLGSVHMPCRYRRIRRVAHGPWGFHQTYRMRCQSGADGGDPQPPCRWQRDIRCRALLKQNASISWIFTSVKSQNPFIFIICHLFSYMVCNLGWKPKTPLASFW